MQEAGFVVDHAEDAEDALPLALSESSDAAIMEVMLPKLDGLSILERMANLGDQALKKLLDSRQARVSGDLFLEVIAPGSNPHVAQ